MGATVAARDRRHRRLRRGRHGRHELRHLSRAPRPARDQDRLELALPLLHRACRWSTCRASARAAVRSRVCARARCSSAPSRRVRHPARRVTAGAAPARASPTPTRCSATCPSTGSRAGACTSTSPRRAPRSRSTSPSRSGIDVTDAAWGIERIVNANMANATRKVLAGHGADPRDLALIAFGGNGAVHAAAIARELGVDPHHRAEGGARVQRARRARRRLRRRPRPLLRHSAVAGRPRPRPRPPDRPAARGRQGARPDRASPRPTSSATCFAQMCYPGQNFDMSVPVPEGVALDEPGLLDLAERFHDQHESERGFCFRSQQPVAARRARHRARHHAQARSPRRDAARSPTPTRPGSGHAPRVLGRRLRRHAGVRRHALGEGATIDGPALIEEPFTVVVLPPDATATLDGLGNYVVTV